MDDFGSNPLQCVASEFETGIKTYLNSKIWKRIINQLLNSLLHPQLAIKGLHTNMVYSTSCILDNDDICRNFNLFERSSTEGVQTKLNLFCACDKFTFSALILLKGCFYCLFIIVVLRLFYFKKFEIVISVI